MPKIEPVRIGVSNGASPKYDIREWAPEREKMGRGVTLNVDEAKELVELLKDEV